MLANYSPWLARWRRGQSLFSTIASVLYIIFGPTFMLRYVLRKTDIDTLSIALLRQCYTIFASWLAEDATIRCRLVAYWPARWLDGSVVMTFHLRVRFPAAARWDGYASSDGKRRHVSHISHWPTQRPIHRMAHSICGWVAGKTVWSLVNIRAIPERFGARRAGHNKVLHKITRCLVTRTHKS